jgi:hypothetical protein
MHLRDFITIFKTSIGLSPVRRSLPTTSFPVASLLTCEQHVKLPAKEISPFPFR